MSSKEVIYQGLFVRAMNIIGRPQSGLDHTDISLLFIDARKVNLDGRHILFEAMSKHPDYNTRINSDLPAPVELNLNTGQVYCPSCTKGFKSQQALTAHGPKKCLEKMNRGE